VCEWYLFPVVIVRVAVLVKLRGDRNLSLNVSRPGQRQLAAAATAQGEWRDKMIKKRLMLLLLMCPYPTVMISSDEVTR
jgi:hypothetical protein